MINLDRFWEDNQDHSHRFEEILPERRFSNRKDLHAFVLLDRLVPGTWDMVSSAEHDEIWFEVSPDDLLKVATEDDLLDLIRCGVFYDDDIEALSMFV